jgi:hypothetical protein
MEDCASELCTEESAALKKEFLLYDWMCIIRSLIILTTHIIMGQRFENSFTKRPNRVGISSYLLRLKMEIRQLYETLPFYIKTEMRSKSL